MLFTYPEKGCSGVVGVSKKGGRGGCGSVDDCGPVIGVVVDVAVVVEDL